MTKHITQQAAAFSLAAMITLSILGSVNFLATQPTDAGLLATKATAAQVAAAKTKSAAQV